MSESHVIPNPARRGAMVPADNASSDAGSFDAGTRDAASFDTGSFETTSSEIAVPETASAESSSTHRPAVGTTAADRGVVNTASFETGVAGIEAVGRSGGAVVGHRLNDFRDAGAADRDEVNAVPAADGTVGGSADTGTGTDTDTKIDTGIGSGSRAGGGDVAGGSGGSAAGNAAGASAGPAGSGHAGARPAADGADGGSGRDGAADGAGAPGRGVVPQDAGQYDGAPRDQGQQDTADQDTANQDPTDRSAPAGSDAASVRRGIQRMFARYDVWLLPEMPLRNGRRADLMGVDSKGRVIIIEIKVQRGDLLGDGKWQDYLDYCDRFYWGVCPDIDRTVLDREIFRPDCCGIVVADGYDGEIVRPASLKPLAPARRKAETERLARAALRRMTVAMDPHCTTWGNGE